MVNTTEQFPDFADAFGDDEPKKSKKGGKKNKKKTTVSSTQAAPVDVDVDHSVPWKGKKSEFFLLKQAAEPLNDAQNPNNFEMNTDQWNFVY